MKHLLSGLHLEHPEKWPHDDSIVNTVVHDLLFRFLEVQSLRLSCCEAGGFGQRSGSGDTPSESCNLIHRQDIVQFLT